MSDATTHLRLAAALATALAGAGRVASLWYRELDLDAVLTLCWGATYLVIAIGLCGTSLFALFAAIVVAAATSGLLLQNWGWQELHTLQRLLVAADALTVMCCAGALFSWRQRRTG